MNAIAFVCGLCVASAMIFAAPQDYFRITVLDEQTNRGVPLVELKTVHNVRCVTDSNGVVAFHEPGLMGKRVFFHVSSHGYEFPADGFGYRGTARDVTPGGHATLKVKRLNIAERLYRITGAGIYRDSVLVGAPVPIRQPALNAEVLGQDSTLACVYRGKLFWLWGDTSRAAYPLGNFSTTCATSLLPGAGGLDPEVGVDLDYFVVGDGGFAKKMCPLPEPGVVWLDGLLTVPNDSGRERLVARYARLKNLGQMLEHGIAVFNDDEQVFERVARWDLDVPIKSLGHPLRHTVDGVDHFYFPTPYPSLRVRANLASLTDPSKYEAFTPLVAGSRYDKADPRLERDASGNLVYGWKRDTAAVGPTEQLELEKAGHLKPGEGRWQLRDAQTGKPVVAHAGSVFFNDYRKRWVMIVCEIFGRSTLGEVWYAEADDPLGPWTTAVRVVTHDKYSFYNPVHHPYFDQDNGRVIYFEGTYTTMFSGNEHPTPRYDYNQIMYRLDLSDPRLRPAQGTTTTTPTMTTTVPTTCSSQ